MNLLESVSEHTTKLRDGRQRKEYDRKWRMKNSERLRQYHRAWYLTHGDWVRKRRRERYLKKHPNAVARHWWTKQEMQILNDGYEKKSAKQLMHEIPNHSLMAISERARLLGLRKSKIVWHLPPWSEAESAYIAGIVDGEGCIGMWSHQRAVRVGISVSNTKRELLDWLSLMFDKPVKRPQRIVHTRWKARYEVAVERIGHVEEIIARIIPYLRVKRSQAETVMAYCRWRRSLGRRDPKRPFTEKERIHARSVLVQLARMNKRGPN